LLLYIVAGFGHFNNLLYNCEMKKILCFGDSNTYGFIPVSCGRYVKNERWSGILSGLLAPDYKIVEEGMNNRCGFFKNPESIKLCGKDYLPVYLQNHKDIDICILALGTNDAQFFYDLDRTTVENGLQSLADSIKEANSKTKIIIIPPVKIQANIVNGIFSMQFDLKSVDKIADTFDVYKNFAQKNNFGYLDFNEFVKPSDGDGLHYSVQSHKFIAEKLSVYIKAFDR